MKDFDKKITYFRDLLDSNLKNIYNKGPQSLTQPINYVLSGSGKRFRPILTMIVADINNIPIEDVLYPSIYLLRNQKLWFLCVHTCDAFFLSLNKNTLSKIFSSYHANGINVIAFLQNPMAGYRANNAG